tara:strand:- start:170 stop:571 length:402 start_codon:yes stop_codon:yes gene_type:complete
MTNQGAENIGVIRVKDVNLWAHVGVLEHERLLGQYFLADFMFWLDLDKVGKDDDLSSTIDYSMAIKGVQKLSFQVNCFTIEKFSDYILDFLEELYGPIPMKLLLRKCNPPVPGFRGTVEIERIRNLKKDVIRL